MNQIWPHYSGPVHRVQDDLRIPRRQWGWGGRPWGWGGRPWGWGFRPYGFGFPFLGGFLGGLTAGALLGPPYYSPYPFYGGYWF